MDWLAMGLVMDLNTRLRRKKDREVSIWVMEGQCGEAGYHVLVADGNWQIAVLNASRRTSTDSPLRFEKHLLTDEAFILNRGKAALITCGPGEEPHHGAAEITALKPSVVYNVPKGIWHTVIMFENTCIFIIENRDTNLYDVTRIETDEEYCKNVRRLFEE